MVITAPPMKPSTLFVGLIQARKGVRPAADPMNSAPTSFATTARASRNNVSVPTDVLRPAAVATVTLDAERISAANEPMTPIHVTPRVVIAMLGIGLDSRLDVVMNVRQPAANARTTTNGIARSPTQYVASGRAVHATIP